MRVQYVVKSNLSRERSGLVGLRGRRGHSSKVAEVKEKLLNVFTVQQMYVNCRLEGVEEL